MSRIYLTTILSCVTSLLFAQPRNINEAELIAYEYLSNIIEHQHKVCLSHKKQLLPIDSRLKTNMDKAFYVFSDSIVPSFVIVSGDKRMKDVLAYSDSESWDEDDIPIALEYLLQTYYEQYELVQFYPPAELMAPIEISMPDVQPLIESQWNQDAPYNDLCPNKCPSGCVATAMSQIMFYHSYPEKGNGYFSYTSRTKKYHCSYDYNDLKFEWSNMQKKYSRSSLGNQQPRAAVANLMFACGVSVGMDYTPDGSGAYMSDVPYALINFFNYNSNVTYRYRPYYTSEEWYSMLCHELQENRPVLYGGVDTKYGGHAFIIDGCSAKTGKFHVNWGWGGSDNGYYELEALSPSLYKFKSYQDMVINISPYETGIKDDVFYAQDFKSSSPIGMGKNITFTIFDVYNYSNSSSYVVPDAKFYGNIGIGLYDDHLNYLMSLAEDSLDGLNNFYGFDKVSFKIKIVNSLFPNDGRFYIAPYVKERNAAIPTRIRTMDGASDYISIVVSNDDISRGDNDEESAETILWSEDFESASIPNKWEQLMENGVGEWHIRSVIMPSDKVPNAAGGKSYVCLDYSADLSSFFNNRTVTKLITEYITLQPSTTYNFSFQARIKADNPDTKSVLSLYCEKNGEWILLDNFDITNQSEWRNHSLMLPSLGTTRFAIEGSIEKGTSLFVDELSIAIKNETSNLDVGCYGQGKIVAIYTITGMSVPIVADIAMLPKGVYIIKYANSKTKRVLKR